MSRTTRKRLTIDWGADKVSLDRHARDNKGRCECCGNNHQIMANRRERRTTKHAIQQGKYPDHKQPDTY